METSNNLCERIKALSGEDVILMFSMGKDAIASYYQLNDYFKNIHLVYQYFHPDLKFINESIDYFEQKFGRKIIKIPHVGMYRMINDYIFQSPSNSDIIAQIDLPNHKYEDYYNDLRIDLDCQNAWIALGVRIFDGPMRRMSIGRNGPLSVKKQSFFPIFDWTNEKIRTVLKQNNIKLPVDYEMFGRSFDGLTYSYIKPLRDKFPDDYNRLKEIYPLIDLEILRYEQI
jgi:3'-phosphoadenosine 5'-phosphosulfate sulfotransferase (PAPS reductase)/FAD synthetase